MYTEKRGFPAAIVQPKASGRGVLTIVNLFILRLFSNYNESI